MEGVCKVIFVVCIGALLCAGIPTRELFYLLGTVAFIMFILGKR